MTAVPRPTPSEPPKSSSRSLILAMLSSMAPSPIFHFPDVAPRDPETTCRALSKDFKPFFYADNMARGWSRENAGDLECLAGSPSDRERARARGGGVQGWEVDMTE